MITIAIVDDKKGIVENLLQVFSIFKSVEVISVAYDGEEIIQQLQTKDIQPEVILMDIEMRKIDGITATLEIKKEYPDIKILMLTVFEQEEKIFQAIQAGADGYLLKDERPIKIIESIENVLEGRMPMSPLIASKTLAFLRCPTLSHPQKSPKDYQLSDREIQILEGLAMGKSYKIIAQDLFISHKTVSNHVENIYRKLNVHSKIEASTLAAKHKWFDKK